MAFVFKQDYFLFRARRRPEAFRHTPALLHIVLSCSYNGRRDGRRASISSSPEPREKGAPALTPGNS
jgi:hypothetical protein